MWLNLIEICNIDDSNAKRYITANQEQGWYVVQLGFKYVTVFATDKVWKSDTANFKSIQTGLYIFKEDSPEKVS